jgi:hypothetical protein
MSVPFTNDEYWQEPIIVSLVQETSDLTDTVYLFNVFLEKHSE